MNYYLAFSFGASLIALLVAFLLAYIVIRKEQGTEKMVELAHAIEEGAFAYSKRQYTIIAIFAIILAAVLYLSLPNGGTIAFGFLLGAFFSALAGFIGMLVAVKANVRTANAARESFSNALTTAFQGGAVTGMAVVGLGLLGVSLIYYITGEPKLIAGFGFGASLISLFVRVGGGIYTKAADVGADLVGKIETGIPEDDPRNPAVIADNVGDNVGDCAGMGADIFESYAVTLIAAMILGFSIYHGNTSYVILPLLICSAGILSAILGLLAVRTKKENPMDAINKGTVATTLLSIILSFAVIKALGLGINLFVAVSCGVIINLLLGLITEYFTSYTHRPVQEIARASQTGATTNIITGLTVGLESTILPVLVICVAIAVSYLSAGIYGIALAATGMLSTIGMTLAIDAYGPIADNAGGIISMSKIKGDARKITDRLDSAGNITKATTKGIAIGSAALSALAIFVAYREEINLMGASITLDISQPSVTIGLLIGGALPFLFCAFCMQAVGNAASDMVNEVRRQFREAGILEGKGEPDYERCVAISTAAAQRELVRPALLAVLSPTVVGYLLGPAALGGMLAGSITTGFLLALMMTNTGAAWDNAKKYIEDGNYGGKGTETHAAAVVGDTIGDPYKDTAGPSINALIKVISMVALLFASSIVAYALKLVP